jgi:hypothetical protein
MTEMRLPQWERRSYDTCLTRQLALDLLFFPYSATVLPMCDGIPARMSCVPAPMKTKKPVKKARLIAVHFRVTALEARSVLVVGSFNDWNPSGFPLKCNGSNIWSGTVMLTPGWHEYRLLVDGNWTDDSDASDIIPNAYGGYNAVLEVNGDATDKTLS